MSPVDFGFKAYVTRGEMATVMGAVAYGMARLALKDPACVLPGGLPGLAIIEVLDSTNGVYLDNPEVVGLFDLLLAGGIIDQAARDRVSSHVVSALITESAPDPASQYAHSYRVPLPAEEPRPITWVSQFMTADYSAWVEGAWLMVNTNGACTAPGTEVV
jgi:hypothetical protein